MGGPGAGGGGGDDLVGRARFEINVDANLDDAQQRIDDFINGTTEAIKSLSSADLSLEGLAKNLRAGEQFEAKLRSAVSIMNKLTQAANELEASFVSRGEQPPVDAQVQIDEFREAAEIVRKFIGETDRLEGIPAKLQPGEKAVRDFTKIVIEAIKANEKFDESTRLGNLGVPQLNAAERAMQAYNATHARAIEENKRFDEQAKNAQLGVPQIQKSEKELQQFNALWARAIEENKRFDEQAKAAKYGVPQLTQAEQKIQAIGKLQAQALKENEEFNLGLRDGTGALIKGVNAAGQASAKLNIVGRTITGIMNRATGALTSFGISSRDVGLILGTGLLSGGVALVAREALQMILAIGRAVLAIAQLGAEVIHLREQVDATFGPAADDIREFSRTAATEFGVSERAALRFTNQVGLIFQSIGAGKRDAAQLTQGLFQVATVLQRVAGNGRPLAQVLTDLQGILTGNIEALRQYGIAVSEADLRAVQARAGLARLGGELTSNVKGYLAIAFAAEQALLKLDEFNKVGESQIDAQAKLAAQAENLQVKLGETLAPALLFMTEAAIELVEHVNLLADDLKDFIEETPGMAEALLKLGEGFVFLTKVNWTFLAAGIKVILIPFKIYAEVIERLASAYERFRAAREGIDVEQLRAARENREASEKARKEAEEFDKKQKELNETREKALDLARQEHENYVASVEDLEKLKDAHEKLTRAREDGARRVLEAEDEYQDTLRQNARAIEDANRRVEDAYESRRRTVSDALRKIEEAEDQNERSIFDARRNLEDAQIQAARSVRDAEERLSDARIENARRVRDAEKALFDARRKQFAAIIDAQIAIQDALQGADSDAENEARRQLRRLQDDESVAEAKKKLDETQADSEKELARLERDLAEERVDAKRKIEEAQIRLDRAIRDAAKRMADAERDYQRAVQDAEDKIEDALRERRRAYEDAAEKVGEALQKIEDAEREAAEAIADAQEEVDELNFKFNTTSLTLGDIIEKLVVMKQLVKEINLLEEPGNTINNPDGTISVHGHGGAFGAGKPRLVGDRGPEIEIPNYPGAIVSNQDIQKALLQLAENQQKNQSNAGSRPVDITVIEAAHPEASAEAVINRMILEGVV